jgi:hypothetical protein
MEKSIDFCLVMTSGTGLVPAFRNPVPSAALGNPKVYVRGRVRHPDHATVTLDGWHEVFSNTEYLSKAMGEVVLLD